MTAEERIARKNARDAARAARAAREREDHILIAEAARAVLRDDTATPGQRLTAIAILDEAEHYYITSRALRSASDALEDFSAALKAATADTTT